jgi:hypothetical protein
MDEDPSPGDAGSDEILGHFRRLDSYIVVLAMLCFTFFFIMATPTNRLTSVVDVCLEGATLLVALHVSRSKPRLVLVCRVIVVVSVLTAIAAVSAGLQPQSLGFLAMLIAAAGPVVVLRGLRRRFTVVDRETVAAALCIYLMIGLFFASAYGGIASHSDDAFKGLTSLDSSNLLYFSFITQATVGYGDITPVSDLARALAVVQSLVGQLYLVTVVALVVSNLGRAVPRRESKDGP